jgi:hypothetical protein
MLQRGDPGGHWVGKAEDHGLVPVRRKGFFFFCRCGACEQKALFFYQLFWFSIHIRIEPTSGGGINNIAAPIVNGKEPRIGKWFWLPLK